MDYKKLYNEIRNPEQNRVIVKCISSIGRYDKGTIVLVKGNLYILEEGFCEECDCAKDCQHKSFNCAKEVEDDLCLKKFEGGI